MSRKWWMGMVWVMGGSLAHAAGQSLPALEALARAFVQNELSAQGASFQLGRFDPALVVPACNAPRVAWAGEGQASGQVLVSCPDKGWSLRLPVTVVRKQMGLVTTRAVRAGEVLRAEDVRLAEVPNPALARNVLSQSEMAVGKMLRSGAPAGAWVRDFMVRAPLLVKANQRVRVLAEGDGFAVQSEGVAVGNAGEGEAVTVRMSSGRLVRGTVATDGSVKVVF
ncbi:flagellar basal body P-ring formation chaperone FlgA [Gulbenkiania mobilis]|uniref:flagellar basal body P-ring formation chaperone FlgA n=1 Tax=Gulbenkiania mobilis TaxID=397457 RepID=UPI0009F8BAD5|nr:flagellar basal body P-ring formation chaperone FlgA [Gulbenkiania mobilis]